jgi:SAM-dependent methyltransferase
VFLKPARDPSRGLFSSRPAIIFELTSLLIQNAQRRKGLKTADACRTCAPLREISFLERISIPQVASLATSSTGSFTEAFLAAVGPMDPLHFPLRILDVGTGTARIPIEICRRRSGIEMTAVDRSRGILQQARRRVAQARLEDTIRIDEADSCDLPYGHRSFDAVVSNGLVHHVPDRRAALREMIRVLRPAGLLFIRDSLPQSDAASLGRILSRDAGGRDTGCRSEFHSSFQGALTMHAARTLASAAGLPTEWVRQSGPRHWLLSGRPAGQVSTLLHTCCSRPTVSPCSPAFSNPR